MQGAPVHLLEPIEVSSQIIKIRTGHFLTKNYATKGIEILIHVLGTKYTGQMIYVISEDGENLKLTGFEYTLKYLCDMFSIPYSSVTLVQQTSSELYKTIYFPLQIFSVMPEFVDVIDKNLSEAKFVGASIGRFSIQRLHMAHKLDLAFPNDNFMIFQQSLTDVESGLRGFEQYLDRELSWLQGKIFDKDIISDNGYVHWKDSCKSYNNIWNKYNIEMVIETDILSDVWFTEKTGKCLASGKPFVLMSGTKSFDTLRKFGFNTYSAQIDESYDLETSLYKRFERMIESLKELYNSPDKDSRIAEMYKIAQENKKYFFSNEFAAKKI
jgi:hypothetical protein